MKESITVSFLLHLKEKKTDCVTASLIAGSLLQFTLFHFPDFSPRLLLHTLTFQVIQVSGHLVNKHLLTTTAMSCNIQLRPLTRCHQEMNDTS